MSPHWQLVFAAWLDGVAMIGSSAFVAWLAWSLFWDLYDHLMEQRTRRRMQALEARSGRDCFRDVKGLTR